MRNPPAVPDAERSVAMYVNGGSRSGQGHTDKAQCHNLVFDDPQAAQETLIEIRVILEYQERAALNTALFPQRQMARVARDLRCIGVATGIQEKLFFVIVMNVSAGFFRRNRVEEVERYVQSIELTLNVFAMLR